MANQLLNVQIIQDSVSADNVRLTTFHVKYWRAIHAELLTHRNFSRNGRSSRAVPVASLLKEEIFMPNFMENKPGMVASEHLSDENRLLAEQVWLEMANSCREGVRKLNKIGVHKQWSNRPLEWFGWIDVLISSTHWDNFWALRIEEGAQPELRELATLMKTEFDASTPKLLKASEWHLPYINDEDRNNHDLETLLKLSTARCARLSYKPFDGKSDLEAELERYNRLIVSSPVHASPAEHQATPDETRDGKWLKPDLHGNYTGWVQYRKTIPNEAVMEKYL